MSLKVSTKQIEYEPIPEGTYGAICYTIADIGVQYDEKFKKANPKVVFIWEICDDDLREDFGRGKLERRAISKTYTASWATKSHLYNDIRPWYGKEVDEDIDLSEMIGKPCMLTIVNNKSSNGKIYSNVQSVSSIMKGFKLGKPENEIVVYDIDESPEETFNMLPEWIRKKIQDSKSPNAQGANSVSVKVDTESGKVSVNTETGEISEENDELPFEMPSEAQTEANRTTGKTKASAKQSTSKSGANSKQTASKSEAIGKEDEDEDIF
jgi:hypothetical protein